MLKEIYTRNQDDPHYSAGTYEVEDSLENLLGQIRMLLFTKPGEIINRLGFGIDLESMIFSTNLSNAVIQQRVYDSIAQSCPDALAYEVKVNVEFYRGTARDICVIDIFIDGSKLLGVLIK